MGAEVIIFGQSLNSHFLKGLTHSAVYLFIAQPDDLCYSYLDLFVSAPQYQRETWYSNVLVYL